MMDWKLLNRNVIEEFRINSGRVAQFGDLPVVILNTIGAKTGNLLEVPLITVIDDGRMYLFGNLTRCRRGNIVSELRGLL